MSQMANLMGNGLSFYWSKYLDLTGFNVDWYNRNWTGNLSGYGDPLQQFSGPVTLTVRKARPDMSDELVDPGRDAGYMADESWTMLYPSSAVIRYRDIIQTSTSEGVVNWMVTTPTAAPWGGAEVIHKTRVRRVVNISGGGGSGRGWPA